MIQGVRHNPFGVDDLYSTEPTERSPRDPMVGQNVLVNAMTWPEEPSQSAWITWTRNGIAQPDVQAQWQSNNPSSETFWQADLGSFARGDQITYTVHANEGGANEQTVGPFSFSVTDWSAASALAAYVDNHSSVDLTLTDSLGGLTPAMRICFPFPDVFHVQLAPAGSQHLSITGTAAYALTDHGAYLTLATSALVLQVQKAPYRLSVYKADGVTLVAQNYAPPGFRNVGWASDGRDVITRIEDHYQTAPGEVFTGFGERYDATNLSGHDVNTWIYNEYGDQGTSGRTYLSAPFFTSSRGYGIYVATTALTAFNVQTYRSDMLGFTATVGGTPAEALLEYYFFVGAPKQILNRYTSLTGRPQVPPKWAFGLWLSANEWNSQAMVTDTLNEAEQNQIPATALVLEQWADEATFYVWHGAEYQPKSGDAAFTYSDFSFANSEWPDPRQMVQDAHQRGVRIVLWQIPAFKEIFTSPTPHYPSQAPPQHLSDKAFAVEQGYVLSERSGKPYRQPPHTWFGKSMVPDFTKPAAVQWWMSKRAYLADEVGIDGFKCDGGEMIFGRETRFADGRSGSFLHNAYPATYIGAYEAYVRSKHGSQGGVFSRSGTAGAQSASIYWAGDQFSTFDSFHQALRAGLTAGASGVPFWSWDTAGFAGPFPSAELYLRASAMATFCPIMQLHSQWARPPDSETRMPWHVQDVTGDPQVVPAFSTFAHVRMNLLPYIYSEAQHSAATGAPLLRAMAIEFPDDPSIATSHEQYMFGGQLLVAPVMEEGATVKEVHVPRGEWYDLWYSAQFTGARTKAYGAPWNLIPVYARPGAIVPLNLNPAYELGGTIRNSLGPYPNLTFRIYPSGQSHYDYFDDERGATARVEVSEAWGSHEVSVRVPELSTGCTLQVISSAPGAVTVAGAPAQPYPSIAALQGAQSGWCWDPVLQATLVKLPAAGGPVVVTLAGVDKAAYQAEFAVGAGTTTNTNHAGFTGIGFVDGLDQDADSVTLGVNADVAGPTLLNFRYACAGAGAATRNVYVDGAQVGTVTLAELADWDTWAVAALTVALTRGPHQVQIRYDAGNQTPINLDSLALIQVAPSAPVVLTQHNDAARSGANLQETKLTPASVAAGFGKLFTYPVTGHVFAQPLYVPGVAVSGKGTRNLLIVATMNNRVYAFDADDGLHAAVPLWERQLEPSIPLPDPNIGTTLIQQGHDTGLATKPDGSPVYTDIQDEVGILSTPVVALPHGVVYVVTASKDPAADDPSAYTHHLHALDLGTGLDKLGGPQTISATFPGQPYAGRFGETDASSGGNLVFQSHRQLQRTGLLLVGDTVYFGFASYGDKDCYHGWILGYSATTLQQTAVRCLTPSAIAGPDRRADGKAGIWQAGQGLAGDENGIYALTGNGGFQPGTDFGDCFIKLAPADLTVLDWFAPFNQRLLADHDLDVGSSGALLIPGTDLLIGGGKESKLFLVRTGSMGHYDLSAGNSQIVENFYVHAPTDPTNPILSAAKDDGTGHHIHGGPVCWRGPHGLWMYVWAEEDVVKAYELLATNTVATVLITLTGIPNAQLGVAASQGSAAGLGGVSGLTPGMPGGMLSISANGAADGILWATHPLANANRGVVPGIVRAYDAADLATELWNSNVDAQRDGLGSYAKFSPPTIAGGKVYVATFSGEVVVYGLL